MNFFQEYPILVPVVAGATVEAGKLLRAYSRNRSISTKDLLQTGGMPSGHSAFVSALVFTMYLLYGPSSPAFTLASALAVFVIYDALKLRRASGYHAAAINLLIREKRYNERLGHTPLEVAVGILIGTAISLFLLYI